MKNIYALTLLFSLASFGQIKFEKGYFIDNQNQRTDCLIRNIDWNDTPAFIEYKLSEDADVRTKNDHEIVEFSVDGTTFISANVDIDESSDRPDKLSSNRNPEFQNKRIFMKRLVDGNAKLYRYSRNDLRRYFFQIGDAEIKQLIYKRYHSDEERIDVAKNNTFRQQLFTEVKCPGDDNSKVAKLEYANDDLIKYFERVNKCTGGESAVVAAKEKRKGSFNLKASVFLGQHSLNFDNPAFISHDFGSKPYVTFGAEAEYIPPFWNNKWSVIAEGTYNNFKENQQVANENQDNFEVKFSYILISAGFRHYFFLGPKSKVFVSAVLNYEAISESSHIRHTDAGHNYPEYTFGTNSIVPGIGAGYNFSDFFVEFRYDLKGNPTHYANINYTYDNFKLIARYKFL